MARRTKGPYVPLSVNYYMDSDILDVALESELLYVRTLAFCRGQATDGYVTDKQLRTVVGSGFDEPEKCAEQLADVGLFIRVDDGYEVRNWLEWNPSTEEVGIARRGDRQRKAKQRERERAESVTSEDVTQHVTRDTESGHAVTAKDVTPSRARARPRRVEESRGSKNTPSPADADDADTDLKRASRFDEFWSHVPKKVGKKEAIRKWDIATRDADPEVIIDGMRRYAQRIEADHTEERFIAHPATWLHQGRWEDQPVEQQQEEFIPAMWRPAR